MDVDDEIEFIAKLHSIDEHRRAITLCQHLLGLPSTAISKRQKSAAGSCLAISIRALDVDEHLTTKEYEEIFTSLLSLGEKEGAARCLLHKARASGLEDDFVRIADLFYHNSDPAILKAVNEAFEVLLEFNRNQIKPEIKRLCDRYVSFINNHDVPLDIAEDFLAHYWLLPSVNEEFPLRLTKEAALRLLNQAETNGSLSGYLKIANLLLEAEDPELMQVVNVAFSELLSYSEDGLDPEAKVLFDRYLDFILENNVPSVQVEEILNDYWSLPEVDGHSFSSILLDYIDASDEVTPGIYYLLARTYGYIEKYEDALKTILPLIVGGESSDRIYMLSYAGEWFFKINDMENARLFLRGVVDAPDSSEHKYIFEQAERMLMLTRPQSDA